MKTILLVEDDARDLELTLIALERAEFGNQVVCVRDGEAALNFLNRTGAYAERPDGNPAFVLLDLKRPKVSGIEVLESIRKTAALKTLPVVMLTSSREERDVLQCYDLKVNAYVVKPMDFGQLVSAIANLGVVWAVLNQPPPGAVRDQLAAA